MKTEKKIVSAVNALVRRLNCKLYLPNSKIIREAHIDRSTFADHYHNADDMLSAYEMEVMVRVRELIQKYDKTSNNPAVIRNNAEQFFDDLLVYIMHNKERFEIEESMDMTGIYERIFAEARPIIVRLWEPIGFRSEERIYSVYVKNILYFFEEWGKRDFSRIHHTEYRNLIMALTLSAPTRFRWITEERLPP